MNVFYTNTDPTVAALDHCKIHRNKMIIEYAQLLSTAHHIIDGDQAIQGIYKMTHKNHPSAIWCRSDVSAYNWILSCALSLCELYTQETGKIHKTQEKLGLLRTLPANIPDHGWQDPPVAAPDEFKAVAVFSGTVEAYRRYMIAKFKGWQQREKPIKVEFIKTPEWFVM